MPSSLLLSLVNSRRDVSTADADTESPRPRVAGASTRATLALQLNWTNLCHLLWVGCWQLLYIDRCEVVCGLLEVNRCIGWSRWFGHCVGRPLYRLVDVGQSLWMACCLGWSLWVGRCGLVAMLVNRIVFSVVGRLLLVAWTRSLCRSIAMDRSLQAGH